MWGQADAAKQEFLDPLTNVFYKDENGQLWPITTKSAPEPMVRCQCKTSCDSLKCSCKSQALSCVQNYVTVEQTARMSKTVRTSNLSVTVMDIVQMMEVFKLFFRFSYMTI